MKIKTKLAAVMSAAMAGVTAAVALSTPLAAHAQAAAPNVTLDLRDAPIRSALEQIFNSAKVDYSIDPTVQGYVNLKVTDIPFESALKLILRSSTTPLTYSKENNVYIVKLRVNSTADTVNPLGNQPPGDQQGNTRTKNNYEQIELTYVDPADLSSLLSVTIISVGVRNRQAGGGGGGGFGGGGFGGGTGGGGGFGGGGGGFGGGGFGGGGGGFGGGGGGFGGGGGGFGGGGGGFGGGGGGFGGGGLGF